MLEAEAAQGNLAGIESRWALSMARNGYVGSGYVKSELSNGSTGNAATCSTGSAKLSFQIQFTDPGDYLVWVRALSARDENAVLCIGIDDSPARPSKIGGFAVGQWSWSSDGDGDPAMVEVDSPGPHTVNVWVSDGGVAVDRLLLTTDHSMTPTGLGPDPSGRADPPFGASPEAATTGLPQTDGTDGPAVELSRATTDERSLIRLAVRIRLTTPI